MGHPTGTGTVNYPAASYGVSFLFWPVIPCVTSLPRTGYGGIQSGPSGDWLPSA